MTTSDVTFSMSRAWDHHVPALGVPDHEVVDKKRGSRVNGT